MADFFGKLKSGAGKVAFEADKMARLNRAQSELGKIKSQIDAYYKQLGELYYHKFINQEAESPVFVEICQNIAGLERQVTDKEAEIQRINAEVFNPQGSAPQAPSPVPAVSPTQAAVSAQPTVNPADQPQGPVSQPPAPMEATPQTKICPNCGREMAYAVKFCPDCGTKM